MDIAEIVFNIIMIIIALILLALLFYFAIINKREQKELREQTDKFLEFQKEMHEELQAMKIREDEI